jgi:hypothetical protein
MVSQTASNEDTFMNRNPFARAGCTEELAVTHWWSC